MSPYQPTKTKLIVNKAYLKSAVSAIIELLQAIEHGSSHAPATQQIGRGLVGAVVVGWRIHDSKLPRPFTELYMTGANHDLEHVVATLDQARKAFVVGSQDHYHVTYLWQVLTLVRQQLQLYGTVVLDAMPGP